MLVSSYGEVAAAVVAGRTVDVVILRANRWAALELALVMEEERAIDEGGCTRWSRALTEGKAMECDGK